MDEASAKIKIQKMTTENQSKATTLRSDLRQIQDEKIEALKNRDYKLVKELKDSE